MAAAMISTCRRSRCLSACFGNFHVHLMNPRACYVGEREVGIFNNRSVEGIIGAVPGRKNAVDTVPVKRRRGVGQGRKRQIIPIPVHFPLPRNKGWIVLQHETG
jgi:hypothetical protein